MVSFSDALHLLDLPATLFAAVLPVRRVQVVGNLPFGIASVLLLNLIRSVSASAQPSTLLGELLRGAENVECLLMFQKEVAQVFESFVRLVKHSCPLENCGQSRQFDPGQIVGVDTALL